MADPVQRDETMTIELNLDDNPEYEIKYILDNAEWVSKLNQTKLSKKQFFICN